MDSTRLPRTSTYRILEQLVAIGWLEREGSTHRLGTRLVNSARWPSIRTPSRRQPSRTCFASIGGPGWWSTSPSSTHRCRLPPQVGDTLDRLSPTPHGFTGARRRKRAGGGTARLGGTPGPTTLSRQHRRSMAVTANWHTSSPGSLPEVARHGAVSVCTPSRLSPLATQARAAVRETAVAILRDLHRPGLRRRGPRPPGPGANSGGRRPVHPLNTCPSHRRAAGRIMRINSRVTGAYMQTEER
ncbi:hypothetical protein GS482_30670 [Rhodococcus hoagii]|nr:hypothetical protein [Prescottella equi]